MRSVENRVTPDRPETAPEDGQAVWRRRARTVGVTAAGSSMVLAGLVLLVLPGPGVLVILAGLAVLATEYAWAKSLLHKSRQRAQRLGSVFRRRTDGQGAEARP